VIKDKVKLKLPVWCPPTYCDPVDPNTIATLIGDKTPHMRVKPDGQTALFIGNSQMTEPRRIEPPKLEVTAKDLKRLPVLPVVSSTGNSAELLYWLKVTGK
jgi:hypothetical protein